MYFQVRMHAHWMQTDVHRVGGGALRFRAHVMRVCPPTWKEEMEQSIPGSHTN